MNVQDKLKQIETILNDYHEELWSDKEVQDNLMYLLGRFLMSGQDLTDEEVEILYEFLNKKLNDFIKTKAN